MDKLNAKSLLMLKFPEMSEINLNFYEMTIKEAHLPPIKQKRDYVCFTAIRHINGSLFYSFFSLPYLLYILIISMI